MGITDKIISSIEAEVEVLKEALNEPAPAAAAAPVAEPAPVAPAATTVAPVATPAEPAPKHVNPIIAMAIAQAAERKARETGK